MKKRKNKKDKKEDPWCAKQSLKVTELHSSSHTDCVQIMEAEDPTKISHTLVWEVTSKHK